MSVAHSTQTSPVQQGCTLAIAVLFGRWLKCHGSVYLFPKQLGTLIEGCVDPAKDQGLRTGIIPSDES